jgi:AAA15 family ATPase/GTPase
MLISFSVENFRSFLGEQTLNLAATTREGAGHDEHCHKTKEGIRLLPLAVMYGANGAGKSNLIKAMRYAVWMILEGPRPGRPTGREAFGFPENEAASGFDFRFLANDQIFRFGFQASDTHVTSEWLLVIVDGKEEVVYERVTTAEGETNFTIGSLLKKESQENNSQVSAFAGFTSASGRSNQLFLHAIYENLDEKVHGSWVGPTIKWFSKSLTIIDPGEHFPSLQRSLTVSKEFSKYASTYLKSVSTGVEELLNVRTPEMPFEQARDIIPHGLASDLTEADLSGSTVADLTLPDGTMMALSRGDGGGYFVHTIATAHQGSNGTRFELPLSAESDGTRRLLHLLPAVYPQTVGGEVVIIDEIDRSLHPLLTRHFVEEFLKLPSESQRQLILTTHDTVLLDMELVRRDEIWFVEKNDEGASTLYSLSEFPVRKDLRINRGYLQGRFGGIPFLGNLEKLFPAAQTDS